MEDFLESNNALSLLGLEELALEDAISIIQNSAKKNMFPAGAASGGQGDGGFNAESLSMSKLAYFEEFFSVAWTPVWNKNCSDAVMQLLKQVEDSEAKEAISGAARRKSSDGSSSKSNSNSNRTKNNGFKVSDDLKKVTAGMIVYLKCSTDNSNFKDASDWQLINDVASCCATLLKVCSVKFSYSYGFVNTNIIPLILTISQSVCSKLIANKDSSAVELPSSMDDLEDIVPGTAVFSQAPEAMNLDDSMKDGKPNSYSSRLRTRHAKVVYADGSMEIRSNVKRTTSSNSAKLILAVVNSNSLLDYATSRNDEHVTDLYLEVMFSGIFCLDLKSEEFCLDKDSFAANVSTSEDLLFKCVFSGEQSAMRYMRLVISILTFSVRDCSIFPKEEKLKITFQKVVNDKIMIKFIERLTIVTSNNDANNSSTSSKRRTKANSGSSSSSSSNRKNNKSASNTNNDSDSASILQNPVDRKFLSVMFLGLLQRLLLSFNGEQKTSTRAIIQNCLCGLINSIGTNLLSIRDSGSPEDQVIWNLMISRFLKFVFKASKSTSHHLRYAATDLSSLILHSCSWLWFTSSTDDVDSSEDLSSDWLIDTSTQSDASISLPKILLFTLLSRMSDNNASVRLKAINSFADLFQTIVGYIDNSNSNYDSLFSNNGNTVDMTRLAHDDLLFLIKSQYLLRLCLGASIQIITSTDSSSFSSIRSAESSESSSMVSSAAVASGSGINSVQTMSLMEILRSRCDDLKSLIVAKSLFCYFHALSINWIRVADLRSIFIRWADLKEKRSTSIHSSGASRSSIQEGSAMMESSAEIDFSTDNVSFDVVPLYICEDDVTLISNYCSYSNSFNSNNAPTSISIRKQSIASLTSILKSRIENKLLAGAWVTSVMVAVADLENSVIDKAVVCIHDILVYNSSNCREIFESLLADNLTPSDTSSAITLIKEFQMVLNVCDFVLSSDKNVLLQKCINVIMQSGRISDIPNYTAASTSSYGHGSGNVPNVDYAHLIDSVKFMCAFDQFKSRIASSEIHINVEVSSLLGSIEQSVINSGWLLMESIMLGQYGGTNKHKYNIVNTSDQRGGSKLSGSSSSTSSAPRGRKGGEESQLVDENGLEVGGSGRREESEIAFALSSLLASKSPEMQQVHQFITSSSDLKIISCIQTSSSQQLLNNLSELFSGAFKEILNKSRPEDMSLNNNEVKMLRVLEALLLNRVNYQKLLSSNSAASISFFDDLLFISVFVECLLIKGASLSYSAISSSLSLRFAISKIMASITSEVFENDRSNSNKDSEIHSLRTYLSLLQWDLTRWVRPILSVSHFVLYSRAFRTRPSFANPFTSSTASACNLSEGEIESLSKLLLQNHPIIELCNRSLFLIGEISILGFVSEEVETKVIGLSLDSSGGSSITNCTVNNDSNRIYIKIITPEAIVSIVQLFLGTSLPQRSNMNNVATSSEGVIKTSDVFGPDFDVNKIVAPTSSFDERSNITSRCFAFISLGKLCIRSQLLARSSLNLYLRELSLNSSDQRGSMKGIDDARAAIAAQSRDNNRSNTLLVLGDLCVKHTNLVERHINQISLCLQPFFYDVDSASTGDQVPSKIFNGILVRKHAFIVITQLLQQDYVKCSGELLLRLAATAANDPDAEMLEFSKLILKRTLLLRNPSALLNRMSEAVVFYNSCTSFPAFNYQMNTVSMEDGSQSLIAGQLTMSQSNESDSLATQDGNNRNGFKPYSNGGANLSGSSHRNHRLKCYALMLEDLADKDKIQVTMNIVTDILSSAIDILESPKHAINSSNADYLSNFNSVIEDTFLILQSPLLKVGRMSQAQVQDELDIDGDMSIGASQIPASQAANVENSKLNKKEKEVLKILSKQLMINEVVPIVFSMKNILQKYKSPLQGWLMGYLMFLTKSHKAEMDQILATDPIMKAEIEYELRHYDAENSNQQTTGLSQDSSSGVEDKSSNRRTSIDRARHIAKVVSSAESVHYSAKKDASAGLSTVNEGRRSSGGGTSSVRLPSGGTRSRPQVTVADYNDDNISNRAFSSSAIKLKTGRQSIAGNGGGGGNDELMKGPGSSNKESSTSSKKASVRFASAEDLGEVVASLAGEPLGSRKDPHEKNSNMSAELETLADRFTASDKGFSRATADKRSGKDVATDALDASAGGNDENLPRGGNMKKAMKKK